ncbi:MAG: hypothetical protein KDA42_03435 [Planctomycetales bacterium]|nr:hypothetical protein [Planctomycetales bacterium]
MSFQFLCPHGHLLEGDHSQMGQQIDCPTCGISFIIPTVEVPAEAQERAPGGFDFSGNAPPMAGNPFDPTARDDGPRMLHIPCPNGHELETPDNMLGQDVLCPFCGEQFHLRFQDSVEARRERREARERKERKVANAWFNRAIIAAIFVVGGLIVMIAISMSN